MLKHVTNSDFGRNVLTLISGTVIAQVLPMLLSLILSRIYSPDEFAIWGLYMSIISILVPLSCGTYEISIMSPKADSDALNLLSLSLFIAFCFSIFLGILIVIFNSLFTNLLGNPSISLWLYFVPFSVIIYAILNTLTNWYNRKKEYRRIAINKINKNWGISIFQLILGSLNLKKTGLITGQIVGDFISTFIFSIGFLKKSFIQLKKSFSISRTKSLAREHKKFPLFTLPTVFMNNISSQFLTLMISNFFTSGLTGAYYFAIRLLSAPMALIGASVSQTFYQKFTEIVKESKQSPQKFVIKIWLFLFSIAIVPLTVLFFWGKPLFLYIFGANWAEAGEIASILSPMILFTFVSSPTSSGFIVLKKQNINVIFGVVEFIYRPLCMYLGYYFQDFYWGLKILVICEVTDVIVYNFVMWNRIGSVNT